MTSKARARAMRPGTLHNSNRRRRARGGDLVLGGVHEGLLQLDEETILEGRAAPWRAHGRKKRACKSAIHGSVIRGFGRKKIFGPRILSTPFQMCGKLGNMTTPSIHDGLPIPRAGIYFDPSSILRSVFRRGQQTEPPHPPACRGCGGPWAKGMLLTDLRTWPLNSSLSSQLNGR